MLRLPGNLTTDCLVYWAVITPIFSTLRDLQRVLLSEEDRKTVNRTVEEDGQQKYNINSFLWYPFAETYFCY